MKNNSLIILGSSSASPHSSRFPSSQIFFSCGKYFLFDCGEGTQIQLRRARIPFENIHYVCISHLHGDHYYGLFGLLSSLNITGRKMPLIIYGPNKTEEFITTLFRLEGQEFQFPIIFKTIPQEPFTCLEKNEKFSLYSIALNHRIECYGYYFVEHEKEKKIIKSTIEQYNIRLEDVKDIKKGADLTLANGTIIPNSELTIEPEKPFSYAYIADTVFTPQNAHYVENVQLLYHEATFLETHKAMAEKTFHSTAQEAAQFAELANAKKLIIGHYSARYRELEGHIAEATKIFANTEAAVDLHQYTVQQKPIKIW